MEKVEQAIGLAIYGLTALCLGMLAQYALDHHTGVSCTQTSYAAPYLFDDGRYSTPGIPPLFGKSI